MQIIIHHSEMVKTDNTKKITQREKAGYLQRNGKQNHRKQFIVKSWENICESNTNEIN